MAKVEYSAVGRRKKAVARVRLVAGDGKITINKRDIENLCFELSVLHIRSEHSQNILSSGKRIFRIMDIEAFPAAVVVVRVKAVNRKQRKDTDQVQTLPHHVRQRDIVRVFIVAV